MDAQALLGQLAGMLGGGGGQPVPPVAETPVQILAGGTAAPQGHQVASPAQLLSLLGGGGNGLGNLLQGLAASTPRKTERDTDTDTPVAKKAKV